MKASIYTSAFWLLSLFFVLPVAAQWAPFPVQPEWKVIKYKDSRYNWIVVENAGKVMFSANAGQSWQDISAGLPTNFELSNVIIREAHIFGLEQATNSIFRFDFINNKWIPIDNGLPEYGYYRSLTEIGSNMVILHQNSSTGQSTMYISKDNGQSWHSMQTFFPKEFTPLHINFLEQQNTAIATGLINGTNAVFSSADDGESWVSLPGLSDACEVGYTHSDDKDILLAMTNCGQVYVSPHAGLNWVVAKKLPNNIRPKAVASAGGRMFLLADYPNNGIFKTSLFFSVDGGENWNLTKMNLSISDESYSLVSADQRLFLMRNNSVLTSDNYGKSWNFSSELPDGSLLRNARIYDNGFRLFLGADGGLFTSSDNGASWQKADEGLESTPFTIDQIAFVNGRLSASFPFAGNLLMFDESSGSWEFGRSYGKVRQVASGNGVLYSANAVFGPSTFQYATNGGKAFAIKNSNLPENTTFYSLAAFGNRVFGGVNGGVMLSTDAGLNWKSWNEASLTGNPAITALAHDPANRTMYAGGPGTGIYKLVKNQSSFEKISDATGATDLIKQGPFLFAFDGLQLIRLDLRTGDEASIVHTSMAQKNLSHADRLLFRRGNLLVATAMGILRSGNLGAELTGWNEGLPIQGTGMPTITTLVSDGTFLYTAVQGFGIYRRKIAELPASPEVLPIDNVVKDSEPDLVVYPNPVSDFVVTEIAERNGNWEKGQIMVVNSLGQVVAKEQFSGNGEQHFRFDLGGQSKGLYQVRLITREGIVTRPFVKIK